MSPVVMSPESGNRSKVAGGVPRMRIRRSNDNLLQLSEPETGEKHQSLIRPLSTFRREDLRNIIRENLQTFQKTVLVENLNLLNSTVNLMVMVEDTLEEVPVPVLKGLMRVLKLPMMQSPLPLIMKN